ncbi:MAG: site-specific DNA-methyltransferase [Actinomycetota bacterium]|nr:site-specific DNA-methyltransferase [Actinomycetota bacterium]
MSRREGHDANEFYRRFAAPTISDDDDVCHPEGRARVDKVLLGDLRDQPGTLAANSVALVVTSPPYYSGKEYETAIGQGHVPASYRDYLAMLSGVFAVCVAALEPGGRIAVNVANLGRKPYRSLSADVIRILEEELGLLLRGEVIWQKAKGAAGNCAWGTYQKPGDPVLRDLTERVVIASKGRFDRAIRPSVREQRGYPSKATIFRDEFLEATVDVWEIPPESATRIGHPAPFPVGLPQRLIDLYTYQGDLVLDPFMGSGTTAVAALRTDRHFVGYDTEPDYVAAALDRIAAERARLHREAGRDGYLGRPVLPATKEPADPAEHFQARGVREGRRARELAKWALEASGFVNIRENQKLDAGVEVNFVANDQAGTEWLFDVSGAFTSTRAGLLRTDTLWKALGEATVVHQTRTGARYVLLTTDKPARTSAGGQALAAVTGAKNKPVRDVIGLRDPDDLARLNEHGAARARSRR